jgi:MFS family permease
MGVDLNSKTAHPMLDLNLFKNRLFAFANFSAIINYASMYIYTILMPFFLKTIKGYNPEHMGLFMMVVPMTMSFISPLSGWLSDRMGSRLLSTTGLAVSGLSLILLSRLNGATSLPVIILSMMTLGIGSGLFHPPNTSAILGSVPKSRLGTASGMVATMRNLGMVTGVAIASGILTSRIQFYHTKYAALHLTASGMQYSSFIGAFSDTLIVGSFVCLIGVITSLNRGRTTPRKKANQDEKGICRSNTPE